MSGQGGSSHSSIHTSLEKEREEDEEQVVGEKDVRPGRDQSQLSSTYFSGEREGGGRERMRAGCR